MKYAGKPVTVTIGTPETIELPPRIYRGRLVGMLFDSDKTFLLPAAMPGIRELKELYDAHPKAAVLVVGHADSRGEDAYNLALSEERARVVAAYLKDDASAWMGYFGRGKPAGKAWGTLEDQYMLTVVAGFTGTLTGKLDAATKAALADWPRGKLVEAYLAQDGTTLPAGTTLETHGCGEFHPEEEGTSEEALRQNRRVEIFMFEGPIEPAAPARCPAPGCTQYAEWVKRTVETIDFSEAPENAVEVELAWPDELIERLPDGAVLILDGTSVAKQEKKLAGARREDGMARISFKWIDREAHITVTAKAGTNAVTLLRDQVVGDLGVAAVWEAELEDLIEPPAGEEPEDEPEGGGDDDDGGLQTTGKMPDDIAPVRQPR